jgi:hypothetical protein
MFRRVGWVVAVAALAASGCGQEKESGPKLTGRILAAGQPCRPASVNDFDLKFLTVQGEGSAKRSYLAEVQEDGTFTVNGSIGKGIPTGRYKVIIVGRVLDANGKPTTRYLKTFAAPATPLEVEITDATRQLTIDLEQKTIQAS